MNYDSRNAGEGEIRHTLEWNQSRLYRGSMDWQEDGRACFTCPEEGLDYLLYSRAEDRSVRLEDFAYLCLKPEVCEEHSMCFQLSFYENPVEEGHELPAQEPQMRIIFGLLPQVETMVPFDFRILDSQVIFPERTPGRLKMSIFGKPVRLCDIGQIRLQTAPGFEAFHFVADKCFFTDTFPDCSLQKKQLIDELGQWTQKDWEGKLSGREECTRRLRALLEEAETSGDHFLFPDWDEFGGWKGKTFQKTGWFHTERENGRFWLVDPQGNAFLSSGLDCINPGVETRVGPVRDFIGEQAAKDCREIAEYRPGTIAMSHDKKDFFNFGTENLKAAFGEGWKESWMKIVKHYLLSWGVNTIGNWSDREFIRFARMPYVIPMDAFCEEGFPHTPEAIFRDFPDVFSPAYEESAARYAKGLEAFAQDPYLIGYFMRNEPAWAFVYGLNIAEEMLANPAQTASKDVFVERLERRYGEVSAFNEAWGLELDSFEDLKKGIYKAASLSERAAADLQAFSEEMITRYVEIPARELRKVDKNHLNLGMRYAYITDKSLLCGSENFDVFSINSYQITPLEPVEQVSGWLDKPVMVGEFHQGALDKGLTAHGIRGVTTQKERGCAYRYYVEQGLTNPYFLGAHYFQLNDQSCLGRFDGENYQIGLVDVCMQEYADMTQAMRECHEGMYRVAAGEQAAWDRVPEDIEPIHY